MQTLLYGPNGLLTIFYISRLTEMEVNRVLGLMKERILNCFYSSLFWTTISTVVIALFTIGLVYFAGRQWKTMDNQLKFMDNQLKQMISSGQQTDNLIQQAIAQTIATNTLAQQAKRSVDISEKALKTNEALSKVALKQSITISRLEQRAWISTLSIPKVKPEIGKQLNIPVAFKNNGKTPADNVTTLVYMSMVKKGERPIFSYKDISGQIISRGIMLPDDVRTVEIPMEWEIRDKLIDGKLTKEMFDILNAGIETIYIYGKISYNDIFGESHWTTFCYIYDPSDGYSITCEEHNLMDK